MNRSDLQRKRVIPLYDVDHQPKHMHFQMHGSETNDLLSLEVMKQR